jgi:purine-cytosine permease-like protein
MSEQGGTRRLGGIEARSIDWVPERDRHGRVSDQSKFWFLGNFQFMTIAIGFIGPGLGLSLAWTAAAGTLGVVIGTLFMAFHANQGAELGLPQMIQSRAQFGYRGVILPLVATLVTYLGFNVVDTILIANGVSTLLGWDPLALSAGVTVLGAVLAIWGHDWLHLVFKILFWISLPLFTLLSLAVMFGVAGGAPPADLGFNWVGFCTELAAGAAYNITYATYVSDYSRYLPANTPRVRVILSVFFGAALSAVWLIALGAWLATRMGASDALVALDQAGDALLPGFGGALALCSVTALTATIGMNAYSGMLTVVTAVDSIRKVRPTRSIRIVTIAGLALLWLVLARSLGGDSVAAVSNVFVVMLYMLAPWTAINLIDYYFVRRGEYAVTHLFLPNGIYGVWRRQGILAYLIGFFASLPFIVIPDTVVGPVAEMLGGIDIGWLVGLSVTGAAYLILVRGHSPAAEQPAVRQSRLDLQALEAAGEVP